ncbi:alpha/beta hydrolase [Halovulum sp. GXIMD14793]
MKYVLYLIVFLVVLVGGIALFAPREPIGEPVVFDPSVIGDDPDGYLYRQEEDVPNLVRGAQKHIVWADPATRAKTEWAVVYVHGFSATSWEIRPVPSLVAGDLGANVLYTRLSGHGRDGAGMMDGTVPAWRTDMAEALAIGRQIGNRVLVIATSTGAALTTLALDQAEERKGVVGVIYVSPNFALKDWRAGILGWPFARSIAPMIEGSERIIAPRNDEHQRRWTLRYPSETLAALGALLRAVSDVQYEQIDIPALFVLSDDDQVVSAPTARAVAARWGGKAQIYPVQLREDDDPFNHVIVGDIMSPSQNVWVSRQMIDWAQALK